MARELARDRGRISRSRLERGDAGLEGAGAFGLAVGDGGDRVEERVDEGGAELEGAGAAPAVVWLWGVKGRVLEGLLEGDGEAATAAVADDDAGSTASGTVGDGGPSKAQAAAPVIMGHLAAAHREAEQLGRLLAMVSDNKALQATPRHLLPSEPTAEPPQSDGSTAIAAGLGGVAAALLIVAVVRSSGCGRKSGPKYSIHANVAYDPAVADFEDTDDDQYDSTAA